MDEPRHVTATTRQTSQAPIMSRLSTANAAGSYYIVASNRSVRSAWPAGSIRRRLAGGFDNDLSGHVRMDSADIRVLTRRREGVGEGVVGIERRRLEGSVLVADPVRAIVVVLPGHRRAGRDSQRRRREGEVVDLDGGGTCRGREHRLARRGEFGQSDRQQRDYPDHPEQRGNPPATQRRINRRQHGSTFQATSVLSVSAGAPLLRT